jgi:hypothetical protein
MHKFPIYEFKTFAELPLDKFDTFKFSVYIIDFNWNYLFVNSFVRNNLGERANDLVGKNIWETFKELTTDSAFSQLREKMENKIPCNFETHSPINGKRLYITACPLEDCYYFTSSILPDREELMNEIRRFLTRK